MTTAIDNRLQQLWEGCLRNDRKQQEALYKLLAPKMLAVCARYARDKDDAQDILQDGFMKIFKNARNYRGEGSLEGWVRRIMVHSAIAHYRKEKRMLLVKDFAESGITTGSSYNAHTLETSDLTRMIQQLPDTYRSVFNMHAIDGYSHQEIGNSLNISEMLSRTTLSRARTMLKNKLSLKEGVERYCMAG